MDSGMSDLTDSYGDVKGLYYLEFKGFAINRLFSFSTSFQKSTVVQRWRTL